MEWTIGQVAKQCGCGVETIPEVRKRAEAKIVDIEPGREEDSPFFGCRTYTVGGKTVGVPPEKWLVDALRRGEGINTMRTGR